MKKGECLPKYPWLSESFIFEPAVEQLNFWYRNTAYGTAIKQGILKGR